MRKKIKVMKFILEISFHLIEFHWHVEPPSGFNKNRCKPARKSSSFSDNKFSQKSNDQEFLESDREKPQSRSNDSQPISKAVALHNFYAQTNRELSFKKGDTILVQRRINDDWLEGEYQGKTGIFPVNYVELFPSETIREPNDYSSKQSNANEQATKIPKSVFKNSSAFQQTAIEKQNLVPELSLPMQKCQVLYDYTPQNPDELEIHVGDIIKIIEMCDDGWYCGVIDKSDYQNTMTFGTFPGNYVKILPI